MRAITPIMRRPERRETTEVGSVGGATTAAGRRVVSVGATATEVGATGAAGTAGAVWASSGVRLSCQPSTRASRRPPRPTGFWATVKLLGGTGIREPAFDDWVTGRSCGAHGGGTRSGRRLAHPAGFGHPVPGHVQ